jgi:hypothetical protein
MNALTIRTAADRQTATGDRWMVPSPAVPTCRDAGPVVLSPRDEDILSAYQISNAVCQGSYIDGKADASGLGLPPGHTRAKSDMAIYVNSGLSIFPQYLLRMQSS